MVKCLTSVVSIIITFVCAVVTLHVGRSLSVCHNLESCQHDRLSHCCTHSAYLCYTVVSGVKWYWYNVSLTPRMQSYVNNSWALY